MAKLVDAIQMSNNRTACYQAAGGYTVFIEQIVGGRIDDSTESYAVRIQRDAQPPHERFHAGDLSEAVERLHTLNIAEFDPDSDNWQPAEEK
jgi:hypothetical protein